MTKRTESLVFAVDPGRDCGWSIGRGEGVLEGAGASPAFQFLQFYRLCLAAGEVDRVVIERFDPRRWDDDSKFTVGVAFALRWLASEAGVDFAEVNAADKEKTIEEARDRLSNRHARDAEAIRLWDLRYGKW